MERIKRNVTIGDVAEKTGLSKTTISRYLNGKFEFMSQKSREKIQVAIEDLHYRPNHVARSLRLSKSRVIGAIVADITSPFAAILVKGISDCCKSYGYNLLIANTDHDTDKEQEYILSMMDQRVDGLIINTTGNNNAFLLEFIHKDVPIVLADRPIFPLVFDTVKTNDYQAAVDTIAYLAAAGFTRVGYFTELLNNIETRIIRLKAYEDACINKLKVKPMVYEVDVSSIEALDGFIADFIQTSQGEVRAIFTANGVVTLAVLHAIRRLKLCIPRDIGVCGFDDWPWASLVDPGITAIAQPSYEVGVETVKQLMLRLHRNKKITPQIIELPNKLIIRGSTRLKP